MAKSGLKNFLMKKHGTDGAVNILEKVEFLNTGIPSLNYVISGRPFTGGIPLSGKMTIAYGPYGAGKTSLINQIIAEAQKKGYDVVYLDTERSITLDRFKQFGVDIDSLTYATPEYIEEVFEIIEDTCSYKIAERDASPTLIVWDSVAGTPTKQTLDRKADDVEVAPEAKALSRGLKRVRGKVKKSNVGILFINQSRANMDKYGDMYTMPGGSALFHFVDLILRINKVKAGKRIDGQTIKISTPDKNRMFRPFQSTEVFFDFEKCFTRENIITAFVDFLVGIGMIGQTGSWCYSLAEVQEIMRTEGCSESEAIKKSKKFYRKAYADELIENDEAYQKVLEASETYIQNNINAVAEMSKDDSLEEEGLKAKVQKPKDDSEFEDIDEDE